MNSLREMVCVLRLSRNIGPSDQRTYMRSGEYKRVDRRFLDTFYRECGREVTLAYTVLNQTNTWAITFSAAAIAPLIALVKKEATGEYTFDYPNPYYWLYLILVWGVLLRFLQRSAL